MLFVGFMIHYGDHTSDFFQKRLFKTLWEAYSLEYVSGGVIFGQSFEIPGHGK